MTDSRWQPIETAPKDGTRFLFLCAPTGHVSVGFYVNSKAFAADSLGSSRDNLATHWMSLPEPPEAAT